MTVTVPSRAAPGATATAALGDIMADKLKIMLVDDHYLVRMGLASIIALEPDMTVCAEASAASRRVRSSDAIGRTSR